MNLIAIILAIGIVIGIGVIYLLCRNAKQNPPILGPLVCPACNNTIFSVEVGGGGQEPGWIRVTCIHHKVSASGQLGDFLRWNHT